MLHTTAEVISIAKASQFLAAVDSANGEIFGQRAAPDSSLLLYTERKSLEWMYGNDTANAALPATTAYVYSLCRGFNIRAQQIIDGGGGGSISPITGLGYAYTSIPITITSGEAGTTYYHPYLILAKDLTYIIYNNQDLSLGQDFTVDYSTGIITFLTVTLFEADRLILSFNKKA